MKKYIILFAFSLLLNKIFAQKDTNSLYAEYILYANTESPRILKGILQVNEKETYYITFFNQTESAEVSKSDNNINIQIGSNAQIIHSNFNASLLISTKKHLGKNYKITEIIPDLNWEILEKNKKISNYNCTKALTEFRGRKYIAWYTEDIPLSYGPYKFNGLPGLILEIYDETERFHWVINKIKSPYSSTEIDKIFNDETKKYEYIDLKDFIDKTEKLESNVETKLPRGISVSVDYKANRNGIEIKYEWEQ